MLKDCFLPKIRNKTRIPIVQNYVEERTGNKWCTDWKGEKKLTLFADDMITYIGNPKESTNNTLQ